MRSAISFIFFTLLLVAPSSAQASAKYIGLEYQGLVPDTVMSNGVKHLGGGLISDHRVDPVYGISQVSKGKTQMLWLEVSTGQNEKGVTGWRVLDVLSYPALTRSQHLHFSPHDPSVECLRGGKPVGGLVALGTISRLKGIYTPQRAWIADIEKKKFTPASIRGLRCTYSEP